MILNNVNVPLDADLSDLSDIVAKKLHIPNSDILRTELYRKSVDARKKDDVHFCCSVLAEVKQEEKI